MPTWKLRATVRTAAVLAVVGLLAGACGGDDPDDGAGDTQRDTITYGASPCCYSLAVERIAKDQGFDAKHGIDLVLAPIDLTQLALLLSNGEVDVDFASMPLLANANLQGNALQCIAPQNHRFVIFGFVHADSPYQTFADLAGKKTGNLPETTGVYLYTEAIMKLQGFDYASDFNVTTGPQATILELFQRGELEGAVVADPPATSLFASDDYRLVYTADEELRELVDFEPKLNCIAARKQWVDEDPDRARRFTQMWLETLNYVHEHPESVEDYAAEVGLSTPEEIEIAKERFGFYHGPAAWNDEVIRDYEANIAWLAEIGMIPALPEGELFVNTLN